MRGVATGVANADSAVGSTSVAPAPPNPSGAGLCVIVAPAPPSASSLGGNVCRAHGGAAPQTRAKAQRRLQQAADALVQRLLSFALDGKVADPVALQAIRDALDRAGLSPKTGIEVEAALKPAVAAGATAHGADVAGGRGGRTGQDAPRGSAPSGPEPARDSAACVAGWAIMNCVVAHCV